MVFRLRICRNCKAYEGLHLVQTTIGRIEKHGSIQRKFGNVCTRRSTVSLSDRNESSTLLRPSESYFYLSHMCNADGGNADGGTSWEE